MVMSSARCVRWLVARKIIRDEEVKEAEAGHFGAGPGGRMTPLEYTQVSLEAIAANRLRSILTTLGVTRAT
jgi:hypothetical protein